jgi:hypothetical protein
MRGGLSDSSPSGALSYEQAPSEEDLRRAYLDRFDAPCPVCGYNLRKLTADICPECGQRFVLQVGTINAPIAPLVALLAPSLLVLGLAIAFSLFWAMLGPPGPRDKVWVVPGMVSGYCQSPVILWIMHRARGSRLPKGRRLLAMAAVSWLINLGLIVFTASYV